MQTIATTPNLVWQLLTKRPENIMNILETLHDSLFRHDIDDVDGNKEYLKSMGPAYKMLTDWLNGNPPPNVWIGTSIENQEAYDKRRGYLLRVSAVVHFLSCEPMIGAVNMQLEGIERDPEGQPFYFHDPEAWHPCDYSCGEEIQGSVDWVICGGESGPNARPMHPDWARSLRDQCVAAGVPFFFKQWGEYLPACQSWPEVQIKPKGFPSPNTPDKINTYYQVGKHAAGSVLDGREWKEFPNG